MTTVKDDPQAATTASLTLTLDGLANGSSRQSSVYDNSTNLYVEVEVGITIVTPASGTLAANPNVTVYLAPLMDGTHYTDGCSGTDSAFTPPGQINSATAAVIGVGSASQVLSAALTVYSFPFYVAFLCCQKMPTKFVIWATNNTGVALGTGCAVTVTPSYYQAV